MQKSIRAFAVAFALWTFLVTSGCGLLVPEHRPSFPLPEASDSRAWQQARLEHFQQDLREHWDTATHLLPDVKEPATSLSAGLSRAAELGQRIGANAACPLSAWHRLAVEAGLSSVALVDRAPSQSPQVELTLETDSGRPAPWPEKQQ